MRQWMKAHLEEERRPDFFLIFFRLTEHGGQTE
jgi:hypothetical protein